MSSVKVKCTPIRKLFPLHSEDETEFCVVAYRPMEDVDPLLVSPEKDRQFIAAGRLLPYGQGIQLHLSGVWNEIQGERRLQVSEWTLVDPEDFSSLFHYLQTFPGLNKKIAAEVIGEFGISALKHLDDDPEVLCRFVPEARAASAVQGYLLRRTRRHLFLYLTDHRVDGSLATRIACAVPSLDYLQAHPFEVSVQDGLPFHTAVGIAKELGLGMHTKAAAMASILNILKQSEGSAAGTAFKGEPVGNTYMTIERLMQKAAKQIGMDAQNGVCRQALAQLITNDACILAQGKYVYRTTTARAEYGIAKELVRLMRVPILKRDYANDMARFEIAGRIRLAPEQRNAVKTALSNPVTLLIGGPGTGKTTIERFIIRLFRRYHPNEKVLLIAPTGKASCRMTESTGEKAFTVHKSLGVIAGEEVLHSDLVLDAGLILVDESSMLGSQEAWALLKAVRTGTRVVFVGDTNQLPSVGAGNVLSELIRSEMIPIAQLVTVYRQKAGSIIAINCARIKNGKAALEDSEDSFQIVQVSTQEEAVQKALSCIEEERLSGCTMDEICVLSPYRRSTMTGVNQLNPVIQSAVSNKTQSISYGKKIFYVFDKVMHLANKEEAVNGDIGTISSISGNRFEVDYGDGRVIQYRKADLKNFDLAFCATIHKVQGDEFKTCIILLMNEHAKMLKRNLIYTAVSRAKSKVVIICQREALEKAIATEDASVRQSRLADILRYYMEEIKKASVG